jgi:hypothetical protein
MTQWSLLLHGYNYVVRHRAKKLHGRSDAISRQAPGDSVEVVAVGEVTLIDRTVLFSVAEMVEAQASDLEYKKVVKELNKQTEAASH